MGVLANEMPGCCALRIYHYLDCLGLRDEYSKKETQQFVERPPVPEDGYKGEYNTASILTISEADQFFKQQRAALQKLGYKLLGTFPGAHPDWDGGDYRIHLYGSKEFRLRGARK